MVEKVSILSRHIDLEARHMQHNTKIAQHETSIGQKWAHRTHETMSYEDERRKHTKSWNLWTMRSEVKVIDVQS